MPRYWVIAPLAANPPEEFNKVWQFDLANNLISIGWYDLGDVSKLSRDELFDACASQYADEPKQKIGLYTNMIWAFYHEIAPGDFVVARRGLKVLAGLGKVLRHAYFAAGKNSAWEWHQNFLEVQWLDQPRNKVFPKLVFQMPTLAELSEEQYRNLIEGEPVPAVPSESPKEIEDSNEFVLEKYLEDFIVSNFDNIFKGALVIYKDAGGAEGQQYKTEIGPIDILAVETDTNSLVVIELKKGRPSDQVVGQVLRYMGWVKKNLCKPGQAVKGLVICSDPDPKLSYALEMTTNIDVRYYSVSFKLRDTP